MYPHFQDLEILEMVENIIQNTDSNYSGQVDYTEYLVAAISKEKLLTRDKLQKAFQAFDLVEFSDSEWRRHDIKGRMGEMLRKHQALSARLDDLP